MKNNSLIRCLAAGTTLSLAFVFVVSARSQSKPPASWSAEDLRLSLATAKSSEHYSRIADYYSLQATRLEAEAMNELVAMGCLCLVPDANDRCTSFEGAYQTMARDARALAIKYAAKAKLLKYEETD